ncbi:MAG: hypothetical protein K8L99_02415 [Anaerolineae bacterium]|nr:hypothetical protein [Anaerolineae bacterium]
MSKSRLEAARELIRARDYDAARSILRAMPESPTAQAWLTKLDQMQAPTTSIKAVPEAPQLQPHIAPLPEPEPQFDDFQPAETPTTPPAIRRTRRRLRWLGFWRLIWGLLALAALVWIGFGVVSAFTGSNPLADSIRETVMNVINSATGTINNQIGGVDPQLTETARDAGDTVSVGLSIAVFACSGLPLLLLASAFYRRVSRVHREERRHREVLETMRAG